MNRALFMGEKGVDKGTKADHEQKKNILTEEPSQPTPTNPTNPGEFRPIRRALPSSKATG
jgi:hypothetical protein